MKMILVCLSILLFQNLAFAKIQVNADKDLFAAIEKQDERKALSLIKKFPINGNARAEQKMTHLMMAAIQGQTSVVEALIAKKVPLENKNEAGDTALAVAVGNEQIAAAQALIKAGAKLTVSCGEPGDTLLMCAVQVNAVDVIKAILKKHPQEKNKKNSSGQTAADLAHDVGTPETQMLLK